MNSEESALYSYGFSTISTAIPAYAKRGDVIFCDEGVCFAIQMGLIASRSSIKFFKHNDMKDLENVLKQQAEEDKMNPKKAKVTRRFLVVEGLYINHGDIPPLPKLIELKEKYKFRLFIEESYSLGVIGKTGKGLTEYWGIPTESVDMIICSLENSFASVGGACIGTSFVINHQRLSSGGYSFSASLLPMLTSAALESLNFIENNPKIFLDLKERAEYMHAQLQKIPGINVEGAPFSPIKHLRLSNPVLNRNQQELILEKIAEKAMDKEKIITVAKYLEKEEKFLPQPSIRLVVTLEVSKEKLKEAATIIKECTKETLAEMNKK